MDGTRSIDTLRQLAGGLDVSLSAIFDSFELLGAAELHTLCALLRGREPAIIEAVIAVARALVEAADALQPEDRAQARCSG